MLRSKGIMYPCGIVVSTPRGVPLPPGQALSLLFTFLLRTPTPGMWNFVTFHKFPQVKMYSRSVNNVFTCSVSRFLSSYIYI